MKRIAVCLLGFTFLLFPLAAARGQSTKRAPTDGEWWSRISLEARWYFVLGYTNSMESVRRTLLALYKDGTKDLAPGDPQFKARSDALISLAGLAEHYDYDVDFKKLVDGVDEFYKDPQNTYIRRELALQYVRDTLNGKNAPRDLEKQLNEWRKIVNK
jgi:hypothetical protein